METLHFGDMLFWGQDLEGVDEGAFFKDTRIDQTIYENHTFT